MSSDADRFIERMGRYFEADGIPRIGGRLFGLLLLQEEPRSLDELADLLRVSKTSVSTNARLLDRWGLIRRVTRPGDRKDYYEAAPDQTRTLELRLRRVREMSDLLAEAAEVVPPERTGPAERIAQLRRFNDEALKQLEALLEGLQARTR